MATPEADVSVPPLPPSQVADSDAALEQGDARELEWWKNPNWIVGLIVGGMVLIIIIGSISPDAVGLILVLAILPALALLLRAGRTDEGQIDASGRLLLRGGYEHPLSEAERSRILEEEVAIYMQDGFFARFRTATTAQLVKPKRFSFLWAFLWLLLFGVGLLVYLIYYAAKRDEGRYVEVDEYGNVKATRQIPHVL